MGIDFSKERWERTCRNYAAWWDGELERPLVSVILQGKNPGRKEPKTPDQTQANCHNFSIPAADIIDRVDYELSGNVYLGDSFPFFNLSYFGPGVVAAFMGAKVDNSSGRVWFFPDKEVPIKDLHFEYDPDNIWLNRIKELSYEGIKRWQGQVLVGMADLGGAMDILSTFRPGENLFYDIYDYPEEVLRCIDEIHNLWHRYWNEINDDVLLPLNPGYCDWSDLLRDKPGHTHQCDFSYMISTEMFDQFARPELTRTFDLHPRNLYHLDGVGALKHLDSLLTLENLRAVQWVPGAGKPEQDEWPEVYQKISAAGKNIQISDGFDCLDTVIEQIGTGKGIHHKCLWEHISNEREIRARLLKYGIE